ncbi:helix-turn-helix domain-containing protein [Actinomadura parmotrematis]|uniref:Helix-turn-helix transcriptional regulator n=1 Tax=Actinomadura parmotrematis TaxID=2864039 RepID=A0ABS7FZP3_9ACTN|nr:helix-turn-helix transcriptional regulator [Actinomadura parmotrematis]MBW8485932.1 helix-turn-helix transcriptional regulator [Actinomadura parmotrematis]
MTDEERDGRAAGDRVRLAAELRGLRELAGLSGRELGRRIGMSQSQISRIEAGRVLPKLPQVKAWAAAVDAPAEKRAWLASMIESMYTEVDTWSAALQGRTDLQGELKDRETGAQWVRSFQPGIVPGHLQTAEYVKRVFAMYPEFPYGKDELAAAVAGRLDRQLALYDAGRRFDFLIGEAGLRWRPGPPSVQLAQLDRIASLATLENVTIGLIPLRSAAVTYLSHGFVIFTDGEEPGHDTYVTIETVHAGITVHRPEETRLYEGRWALLEQMAVFGDEAAALLGEIAADIREDAR